MSSYAEEEQSWPGDPARPARWWQSHRGPDPPSTVTSWGAEEKVFPANGAGTADCLYAQKEATYRLYTVHHH